MANLARLFATAKSQVDQAVMTAATTVTFGTLVETPDPAEPLDVTEALEGTWTAEAVVSIVGDTTVDPIVGVELREGDWKILLSYDTQLPASSMHVDITSCLAAALVGQRGKVLGSIVDSSAAYGLVYARPRPVPGG